ncbi:hypothetical protein NE865_14861 [Phthorimaea operculella]|nr:hypothetical protein NE865_14861 [Phthorimaea operculella]
MLPGLQELTPSTFNLLGSPIFPAAIPEAFESRRLVLLQAQKRLKNLSAHALVLLRVCFAVPKLTYFLRTTPTWLFSDQIGSFDDTLKDTVESILNVSLNAVQWNQTSLPVRYWGQGVRRAQDDLHSLPGWRFGGVVGLYSFRIHSEDLDSQRSWDDVGAKGVLGRMMEGAVGADLARLKAVSQSESGAWLQALPSPHLGTLLDDNSLRVAVALRLGCDVCERHQCTCGSMVESNGHHALSCCRCSGRFPRHHALNDIVRRALVSANIPCILEPQGLSRSNGKRPDGMTLVPWKKASVYCGCHV